VLLVAVLAGSGMLLSLALAAAGLDYVSSRNLVAMLVPVAIVLGYGFAQGVVGRLALGVICLVSIATVVGVAASPEYQRRDWRGAAQALGPARSARLLVVSPPFHNAGPFGVYFGAASRLLGAASPRVGEVAVVALAGSHSFGPDTPRPPGGPAPAPPPGFHVAEDRTTRSYRLVRFTSARPRLVSRTGLPKVGFPGVRSALVLQP
jgi:hypothetical protein